MFMMKQNTLRSHQVDLQARVFGQIVDFEVIRHWDQVHQSAASATLSSDAKTARIRSCEYACASVYCSTMTVPDEQPGRSVQKVQHDLLDRIVLCARNVVGPLCRRQAVRDLRFLPRFLGAYNE
jgi:hypothetical protein